MKMVYKLLLVFTCIVLLTLCACGEQTPSPVPAEPDQPGALDKNEQIQGDESITEEELEELFLGAITEIDDLATENPCDYLGYTFDGVEVYQEFCITIDQSPYVKTSLDYDKLVEYYENYFTGEALEWILSTKFMNVAGKVYCCAVGGRTGGWMEILSISNLQDNVYRGVFLHYYGVSDVAEENSTFEIKKTDAGYKISDIDYLPASLQ